MNFLFLSAMRNRNKWFMAYHICILPAFIELAGVFIAYLLLLLIKITFWILHISVKRKQHKGIKDKVLHEDTT